MLLCGIADKVDHDHQLACLILWACKQALHLNVNCLASEGVHLVEAVLEDSSDFSSKVDINARVLAQSSLGFGHSRACPSRHLLQSESAIFFIIIAKRSITNLLKL